MSCIFQGRHSGMEGRDSSDDGDWNCRNPGFMDGFELAIPDPGYPLPGEYDELAQNLTK
jgi:hypothetical protein